MEDIIKKFDFWFSQKVLKYDVVANSKLKFSNEEVIVDWDHCLVDIVGKKSQKTRIVLRSSSESVSDYIGRTKQETVEIRYMIGIDVSEKVSKPYIENYEVNKDKVRKNLPKECENYIKRAVFSLDDKYWIWEEYSPNIPLESTNIYKLYVQIIEFMDKTKDLVDYDINEIFKVEIDESIIDNKKMGEIIPIIYQPAIDELKNFVREVHCHLIQPNVLEVTLIFNNEELRKFSLFNKIYEKIRLIIYGRIMDIESFRIYLDQDRMQNNNMYVFEKIYSSIDDTQYGIIYDTIHGDSPPYSPPPDPPKRKIKYYFIDYKHPVIFINTSNHAMAESDNNHEIWKWEYIPFLNDSPVIFGTKSRKQIESIFKPLTHRILGINVTK
jgi:hypothetical protein